MNFYSTEPSIKPQSLHNSSKSVFSLVERLPNIAAVFFDSEIAENVEMMNALEDIDDDCDNNGIPFVKIEDVTKANDEYGLDSLPALLYWKNGGEII